jgi:bacterioferritin
VIFLKYKVDLPYPEVKVEKPNIEYAKILSNDYAGKVSEETAINLYSFQHFALDDEYYTKILKNISIVEMKHLELLGETIKLLGLEPVFMSYNKEKNGLVPWKSSYIDYKTNLEDVLKIDIEAEEKAIENYRKSISLINDKYIKKLLERIIMDEELHLNIFKDLLNNIK